MATIYKLENADGSVILSMTLFFHQYSPITLINFILKSTIYSDKNSMNYKDSGQKHQLSQNCYMGHCYLPEKTLFSSLHTNRTAEVDHKSYNLFSNQSSTHRRVKVHLSGCCWNLKSIQSDKIQYGVRQQGAQIK